MNTEEAASLRRGDLVWCAWSRWGKQAARLISEVRGGRVTVVKYRANSKRWTGALRISVADILSRRDPQPFDERR